MLLIGEILVSDALIEEQFVCHLDKCKGACCSLGDYGAPLDSDEINLLDDHLPAIEAYLEPEGLERIKEVGVTQYFAKPKFHGTALRHNGACVFLHVGENGVAECGIENAWEDGVIEWKKPMSCHLYPVRVRRVPEMNFEALNYDDWSICKDACKLGKSLKVPLYVFVREAIERRYGEEFWRELDEVAKDLMRKSGNDKVYFSG
jgi:Fe-S-cluster containining protein